MQSGGSGEDEHAISALFTERCNCSSRGAAGVRQRQLTGLPQMLCEEGGCVSSRRHNFLSGNGCTKQRNTAGWRCLHLTKSSATCISCGARCQSQRPQSWSFLDLSMPQQPWKILSLSKPCICVPRVSQSQGFSMLTPTSVAHWSPSQHWPPLGDAESHTPGMLCVPWGSAALLCLYSVGA